MRMAGSASAQSPQKMHWARSRRATRRPSLSSNEIAAVGQTAAAGRASFQLAQSIAGLPRAREESSAGAGGYVTVALPVLRLWRRISNINQSAIGARIGEIETFVHDGKIGNDVAED